VSVSWRNCSARRRADPAPRRYTVEAGKQLDGRWELAVDAGDYDLWLLAPNGFHRHITAAQS
jgi:phospholipase C